jgi:hypothetical protein
MRVATETHRRNGVTLVAVRVEHDGGGTAGEADERGAQPQRVRLANECAGPVWPPREDGLPAPGWDDGGWEGVLAPDEVRPLGYATPGEPSEPPVTVAWTERAADGPPDAREAVAEFGDPRPPRDAVPAPDSGLPESVRDWLGDVSTRATADAETAADREAVSALAARASVLRERVTEE